MPHWPNTGLYAFKICLKRIDGDAFSSTEVTAHSRECRLSWLDQYRHGQVRPVGEGAKGVVWAATLGKGGPTGGFFRDGQPIEF